MTNKLKMCRRPHYTRTVYRARPTLQAETQDIPEREHICTGCEWAMNHGDHYSCLWIEGYCVKLVNGFCKPATGVRTSSGLKKEQTARLSRIYAAQAERARHEANLAMTLDELPDALPDAPETDNKPHEEDTHERTEEQAGKRAGD